MGKDPRFFKSPEVFLPERFVRGDGSLSDEYKNTHPYATLPFGFGLRSCVGQRFAETEMLVITAKFFRCFEAVLSQETNQTMEFVDRIFTAPKNEVSLLIKPRK
ncbi:sterol 26-hydroxylase, mitochondrial-like [Saccostrea echinata]|uniref:sterol 26-hydroxylase, mitochondrial-like n=1 Tax=Saccostrea echinata TaxID=191078 RepID=UPI002A8194FB|nr:sterol 26-hydroxylase, mitochondrial-like [Saccostrea echinata]